MVPQEYQVICHNVPQVFVVFFFIYDAIELCHSIKTKNYDQFYKRNYIVENNFKQHIKES